MATVAGQASYAWVPVELIQQALAIGWTHGFNVEAIEGDTLAIRVDLGCGRVVHLVIPTDEIVH